MKLAGKHIILGITGSIAAYKAAMLVRLLVKEGAEVKVIMTPLAKEFITPLTMATLSKNPILVDFFNPENGDWNSHVDLGIWADLFIIAPASANTIAKMAHGIADNLLLTTYLSAKCPIMVAPAMDLDMYIHNITQHNIKLLSQNGVAIIEAATGELASGLTGKGRMEEPEQILNAVVSFFNHSQRFNGINVLITSGPTYEPIDPVRFIGNFSSGKMGTSLAESFANQGASVTYISGPAKTYPKHSNIHTIDVVTTSQMHNEVIKAYKKTNIAVLAAAVADYTPAYSSTQKIKKEGKNLVLELVPTIDIAASIGKTKKKNQMNIGFALETQNEQANAFKKLKDKNFDLIILNSLNDIGAGFGYETNKVTIIDKSNKKLYFDLKPKSEIANDIVDLVAIKFEQLRLKGK